jgi:hypothetical protein
MLPLLRLQVPLLLQLLLAFLLLLLLSGWDAYQQDSVDYVTMP